MQRLAEKPFHLLGATRSGFLEAFAPFGMKPADARRLVRRIHRNQDTNAEQWSRLPSLDSAHAFSWQCSIPKVLAKECAEDGTSKFLLELDDGACVESVVIPQGLRTTVCVSSQAGCALRCAFCATGEQGFRRQLRSDEIIAQLWIAQAHLRQSGRQVTNVVMMGMGEPLLNCAQLIPALELMRDDDAYALGCTKVSVSTVGVVPGMREIARRSDVCLIVSLHAPDDALRDQLVPLNRKYPLSEVFAACEDYLAHRPAKRKMLFAYTLLADVNDHIDQARLLAERLRHFPAKLNLIPFNSYPGAAFRPSSAERVHAFREVLHEAGIVTVVRRPRGASIAAACGQLSQTGTTQRTVAWRRRESLSC